MSADYAVGAAAVAQNSGACAVSEKNASIAVSPVSDRRQFLSPDHKDSIVRMRCYELLGDLQTKEKAGAGCGKIETGGVGCPDLLLNEAGRGREKHIGSGRCHKNQINFFR